MLETIKDLCNQNHMEALKELDLQNFIENLLNLVKENSKWNSMKQNSKNKYILS